MEPSVHTSLPSQVLFFCGICGYTQRDTAQHSPTLRCCRCYVEAHISCFNVVKNEQLPSPDDTGASWTCACCESKIEGCQLSKNASMFSKKVDRTYTCVFCNHLALRRCTKQLHLARIPCGLWAHSICYLLANEACPDEFPEPQDWANCNEFQQQQQQQEESPYDDWDSNIILKFTCGSHIGKYVIVLEPPSSGKVLVKFRESSSHASSTAATSNEPFLAECTNLQLGVPRVKDMALVLAGPLKDHVGRVKAMLSDTEVVLDNLPPVDFISLCDLAWLHVGADSAKATSSSERSGADSEARRVVAQEQPTEERACAACLQCHQSGEALVRCGESGCAALFHVPCALADPRFTVQVTEQEATDYEDKESSIQLLVHCPEHKKSFYPTQQILESITPVPSAVSVSSDTSRNHLGVNQPSAATITAPTASTSVIASVDLTSVVGEDINLQQGSSRLGEQPTRSEPSASNMVANCNGCGKIGEYKVSTTTATAAHQKGNKQVAYQRHNEHRLSARESGTGKPKICGRYFIDPRPAGTELSSSADIPRPVAKGIGTAGGACNSTSSTSISSCEGSGGMYNGVTLNSPPAAEPHSSRAGRTTKMSHPFTSLPLPTTFAPGMDSGECTVDVKWQAYEDLTETDIQDLFAHCGCIFKAKVDTSHKTATLCFTEKKAAQTAVSICRSNTFDVTTPHGLVRQKLTSLQVTQIGAEVFVGGLEIGVTEVKLKRAFLPFGLIKAISVLGDRCVAFVHYYKLSSAQKAIQELNQTTNYDLTSGKLTVSLRRATKSAPPAPVSAVVPSWTIDREPSRTQPPPLTTSTFVNSHKRAHNNISHNVSNPPSSTVGVFDGAEKPAYHKRNAALSLKSIRAQNQLIASKGHSGPPIPVPLERHLQSSSEPPHLPLSVATKSTNPLNTSVNPLASRVSSAASASIPTGSDSFKFEDKDDDFKMVASRDPRRRK